MFIQAVAPVLRGGCRLAAYLHGRSLLIPGTVFVELPLPLGVMATFVPVPSGLGMRKTPTVACLGFTASSTLFCK